MNGGVSVAIKPTTAKKSTLTRDVFFGNVANNLTIERRDGKRRVGG